MSQLLALLPPFLYVGFSIAERVAPAAPLPAVRFWKLKGLLFFFLSGLIAGALPSLWAPWVRAHRLIDLEGLGTMGGALLGIVVTDLFVYWAHRLRHVIRPLWRLHQMHHSVERVDATGAFFFHPVDLLISTVVTTFVASTIVGVGATAATVAGTFGLFMALFTHANLRTPRWLGWMVQRPESHGVHHQRGVHAYNYGSLALWDLVFRTYRNPTLRPAPSGFWDGASARMGCLLAAVDVTAIAQAARGERSTGTMAA